MNRSKFAVARAVAMLNGALRNLDAPSLGTRVLMYHDVNDHGRTNDIYSIPLHSFSRAVSALTAWANEQGHPFVAFSAAPTPGIAVTFDDGYSSTLRLAAPVLASHGIPFHVFVTKSYAESGDARYLSLSEIRELSAFPGATLGLHGASHTKFSDLNDAALRRDLLVSRDWLEQLAGRTIDSLSYPHGDFTDRMHSAIADAGLTAAACSNVGTFSDASQRLSIPRVDLWSLDSSRSTISKTRGDWDLILP